MAENETILGRRHITLKVLFDMVSIEITCDSNYEAQVLFDDITERTAQGQQIIIEPCK